jgi:hypothetical protein
MFSKLARRYFVKQKVLVLELRDTSATGSAKRTAQGVGSTDRPAAEGH